MFSLVLYTHTKHNVFAHLLYSYLHESIVVFRVRAVTIFQNKNLFKLTVALFSTAQILWNVLHRKQTPFSLKKLIPVTGSRTRTYWSDSPRELWEQGSTRIWFSEPRSGGSKDLVAFWRKTTRFFVQLENELEKFLVPSGMYCSRSVNFWVFLQPPVTFG